MCALLITRRCGKWEGWDPDTRFNHSSGVTVVSSTDRSKSICNRCVTEYFGGVFVCCLFRFVVVLCLRRKFYQKTKSDLFLFSCEKDT